MGIPVQDIHSIQVMEPIPLTSAQLSERFPLQEVAKRGGGVINTLEGARMNLKFHRRAGFIELEFGGKKATVHKDELLYFARLAKGSMAL